MRLVLIPVSLSVPLSACQPNDCSDPSFTHVQGLPRLLSETGLTVTGGQPPGLRAYTPRFELWSDGAQKCRWFFLPDGAQVDTSVPDDWRFPRGTRFWKSSPATACASRPGSRGSGATVATTGAWRPTSGVGVRNALGTPNDVPTAAQCWAATGGAPVESSASGHARERPRRRAGSAPERHGTSQGTRPVLGSIPALIQRRRLPEPDHP